MKFKIFLIQLICFFNTIVNAQLYIDSLQTMLPAAIGEEKVEILKELAIEYYLISEFPTALDYFEKGIDLAMKTGDENRLAVLYYNRALLYKDVTDYEKAVEQVLKVLELFQKTGNEIGEAAVYNVLGAINAEQSSYEPALEYFQKCKMQNEKIGHDRGVASALINIGSIHHEEGDLDKALNCFQQALKVDKDTVDTAVRIAALSNVGIIYQNKGQDEKAMNYFQKALDFTNKSGNALASIEPLTNLGMSFKNLKQFAQGEDVMLKALRLAEELGAQDLVLNANEALSELYAAKGDFGKSWQHLKEFKELNATLFEESRRQMLLEMDAKFKVSKKEQENNLLKKEKDTQSLFIKILVIGLIVLAFFLTIISLQKIRQGKAYKALVQKNLEVVASEKELKATKQQLQSLGKKETIESPPKPLKYADSALSDTQKDSLVNALKQGMEEQQFFLDSSLSLKKLAEKLNTNRTYLSQIINQEYGKSFNNFLNEYRIREARRVLSEPDLNLTIEGVAKTVGFNSVPSFNNAFKKFAGVTPSFFMKSANSEFFG